MQKCAKVKKILKPQNFCVESSFENFNFRRPDPEVHVPKLKIILKEEASLGDFWEKFCWILLKKLWSGLKLFQTDAIFEIFGFFGLT